MNKEIIYKIAVQGFKTLDDLKAKEKEILVSIEAIEKAQRKTTNPPYAILKKELEKVRKEYKETEKVTLAYGTAITSQKGSIVGLAAQLTVLQNTYKKLGTEQQKASDGRAIERQVKNTIKALEQQEKRLKISTASFSQYRGAINSFSTNVFSLLGNSSIAKSGLTGGITSLVSGIAGSPALAGIELARGVGRGLSEIVKFNASLADVQADLSKTANLSNVQVEKLTEDLKGLDTRTPIEGLLKIGEVLGKLGVEITPSVIASMDKLNVALSDEFGNNPEKITESVGKLKTLFTEFNNTSPEVAYLRIGNALNVLAASGASTAPIITEFSKRIAGTVGSLGLTASEILGVSATLEELGTTAYRGSSGFARVIFEITKAPDAFSEALKITDATVQQFTGTTGSFKDLINKDLYGAFTLVLERLREMNLSTTEQSALFDALKINGLAETEVLNKLQVSQDLLANRVSTANKALQNQNSILTEFSKKNNNLAGELQQVGNNLQEIFISSGLQGFLAKGLESINKWFVASKSLNITLGEEQEKINELSISLLGLDKDRKLQIEKLNELKKLYPNYFENLKTDKAEISLLSQEIFDLNDDRESQLQKIALLRRTYPEYIQNLQKDTSESGQLLRKIFDLNTKNDERITLINTLKTEFPSFFEGLQKETDLTNQLKNSLDGVNEAYNRRRYNAQLRENILKDSKYQVENTDKIRKEVETALVKDLSLPLATYGKQLGVVFEGSALETAKKLVKASKDNGGILTREQLKNLERDIRLLTEYEEKAGKVRKSFEEAVTLANKATEGNLEKDIERVKQTTTVLKNSLSDYNKFEKQFNESKAKGDNKRQTEALKNIKELDNNVAVLLANSSVSLVKDIESPSDGLLNILKDLETANNATKVVSSRILGTVKGLTLGGEEFEETDVEEFRASRRKRGRKTGTTAVPSDNAFENALETATKRGEDYKNKYKNYLDKLNRDIEEFEAKGQKDSLKKQIDLSINATKDRVAKVKEEKDSIIKEYNQGIEKYSDAIKKGEEHLQKLKETVPADNETKQKLSAEINETEEQLQNLKKTHINIQNEYLEEISLIENATLKEIKNIDKALGFKIEELRTTFAEKATKQFIDKVDLVELTESNKTVDQTTERLFALELKRLSDNKAILSGYSDPNYQKRYLEAIGLDASFDIQSQIQGKLTNKDKKRALLQADRINDSAEIKIKQEGLEQKLTVQQNALDALVKQKGLALILPAIFSPVPDEAIEKQKKKVEGTQREITSLLKAEGEKQTAIQRTNLEEAGKEWEKYKDRVKDVFQDILENFLNTQLEIERNEAQATFDEKISLLDKEYEYKASLYANDAANLKRLEKLKAEEKLKIEKAYAEEQRKIALKQLEINTASAIVRAYASLDPISATIASIGIIAIAAFQAAEIKKRKFAKGGFVPNYGGAADETGQVPVPITAHVGEFIVPTRIVQSPQGRPLISAIQQLMGGRGNINAYKGIYADGSFVIPRTQTPQNFTVMSVSLSDSDLDKLSKKLYSATLKGTADGTVVGNQDYLRLQERMTLSQKLSTI